MSELRAGNICKAFTGHADNEPDSSCSSFSSSDPAVFSLMKFSATVKVECESSILWISFAYKEREIRQNPYNGKEMNESDITEVYTMMENLSER